MTAYLSLGSNISPRHRHIDDACRLINQSVGQISARSDDFYSAPWGYDSDCEYLNIAVRVETDLSPLELLHTTQQIERQLGRTTKGVYADRTIDIDIMLWYNEQRQSVTVSSPELTIPHQHLYERDFMLVPLKQILN